MNTSTIGNGAPLTPGTAPKLASQDPAGSLSTANLADLATQELLEWLGVDKAAKRGGKEDPIANRNGAPALDMPVTNFGPNDLQDLLRSMHSKVFNVQMDTSLKNLEIQRTNAKNNTDHQLAKIQEWIQKSEEKENMSLAQKILNWFTKVFAVIASFAAVAVAAVATVGSGGAAAVLLALAVVAAVASVMSLADAISQEAGGPEISINSLVQAVVVPMLTAFGMDEDKAKDAAKAMSGALAVLLPVLVLLEPQLLGGAVESFMKLSGVERDAASIVGAVFTAITAIVGGIAMAVMSGGSSVAQGVSTTVQSLNRVVKGVSVAVSSAGTIAAGAVSIAKGHLALEADKLIADRRDLQAFMVRIQALLDQATDDIKTVIEAIERSNEKVAAMMSGAAETALQVAQGVGRTRNTA